MLILDGEKIHQIRKSLSLSQKKFLEYLTEQALLSDDSETIEWIKNRTNPDKISPLSVVSLSNIENNNTNVRPPTARFFATGLGLKPSDILKDTPRDTEEEESEHEDSDLLIPVMLTGDMVYEGPDAQDSVDLDEIIAVRESDRATIVLGYGRIEESPLKKLVQNWSGGGFEELLDWAGIEKETAGGVYVPDLGLLIGPKEKALLLVGRSGSQVRLKYKTGRTYEPSSVARFSNFRPFSSGAL